MSAYVTKHNVPILDEHTLTHEDDEGREVRVPINEARLREIAERNNRRAAETGDLTPIIIGHTRDDADEGEQPEIVGYAGNFQVRPFARTGKKALTATFKFFRSALDKVRRYPRRSVELWLSDWKIDPIALLGATTPERDLGLLRLARSGAKIKRILYSHENHMTPPTPPATGDTAGGDLAQQIMAMLQQSAVWKWAEQQMAQQQADEMAPPAPDPLGASTPAPPQPDEFGDGDFEDEEWDDPDASDEDDWDEDEMDDDEDADEDDEPVRYQSSVASGTNTYCPPAPRRKMHRQTAQTAPHDPAAAILDRVRMAADQRRAEKVRYERALGRLQRENTALRLRFQKAERERDLVQLEAEGYLFDRVEELDAVAPLSDEQYQRHVAMIRKRYQRAPIGEARWNGAALRSAAGSQGRTRERCQEIADHAAARGLSYAEALAELDEQ